MIPVYRVPTQELWQEEIGLWYLANHLLQYPTPLFGTLDAMNPPKVDSGGGGEIQNTDSG